MVRPVRLQRKRAKGFKLESPNELPVVYVGRPSKWGNPFVISFDPDSLEAYEDFTMNVDLWIGWPCRDRQTAVEAYRQMAAGRFSILELSELRGKNLSCWCPLDQPCHADVLLKLANGGYQ